MMIKIRELILPVVLYGFEMCYFTLREEYRLKVCENRAWKKTFWCKRDKLTGD